MTVYCTCGSPLIDVEHDAGCRRCGLPVNFTPPACVVCDGPGCEFCPKVSEESRQERLDSLTPSPVPTWDGVL